MAEITFVLGEPRYATAGIGQIKAPSGQLRLVEEAVDRLGDNASERLREEYLALGRALRDTVGDFAIVNLATFRKTGTRYGSFMRDVAGLSGNSYDWRVEKRSSVAREFPRDALVALPGLWLFDERVFPARDEVAGDVRILTSPIGGGGMMLTRQAKALVSERVIYNDGQWVESVSHLAPLLDRGIQVGVLPNPFMVALDPTDKSVAKAHYTDHLDREMVLIEDTEGRLHLLIDSKYQGYDHTGDTLLCRSATLDLVKRVCERLEVEVHPVEITVPYSLNLLQTPTGEVLMTSGDEEVEGLVRSLVGDRVVTTEIPVEAYPAYTHAGIHCLIGEFPSPVHLGEDEE